MIVYKAQNKINGKIYIGQTVNPLPRRIMFHQRAKTGIFPAALRKYGIGAFNFAVIDFAQNHAELKEKEIRWIGFYKSKVPNGYNITDGGNGGMLGYKASSETRKKQSESLKGKNAGKKNGMFGKSAVRGKHHSEEAKRKNAQAKKEKWRDPEYRRKILEARKRPSYRAAFTGTGELRWKNPEYRAKTIRAQCLKWEDPDYRERQLRNLKQNQRNRWGKDGVVS